MPSNQRKTIDEAALVFVESVFNDKRVPYKEDIKECVIDATGDGFYKIGVLLSVLTVGRPEPIPVIDEITRCGVAFLKIFSAIRRRHETHNQGIVLPDITELLETKPVVYGEVSKVLKTFLENYEPWRQVERFGRYLLSLGEEPAPGTPMRPKSP